jgi:D-3-phosphoglycerate dehydrogenase
MSIGGRDCLRGIDIPVGQSWRIVVTDGLAPEGLARLRAEADVIEADGLELLRTAHAVIVRSRTRLTALEIAKAHPPLVVIGRAGVGVDNIDLAAARAAGVVVVNAPQAATNAVAEHALGLMLSLARRIPQADASMKRGEWRKREWAGSELDGKTLGLVGLGRIGRALGAKAAALGMRVMAYDPLIGDAAIRQAGAEPRTLEALLAEADYVSLHVPFDESTRGMIGEAALGRMKPGARLISTARGGVVDERALGEALEGGRLAGAALDVFDEEPPLAASIVSHPAVIATPHVGAQTVEAQRRAAVDIAGEVLAALNGRPLRWRVA